jgi:aminoglycoside phosphotransferase (APT) family kinase protein
VKTEQQLVGGNSSAVSRVGDTVHREAGPWSPQVHKLLTLLNAKGVAGVPKPLGMDEQGREVLTFLHGEVGTSPLSGRQRSEEVLLQAAKLLAAIHEATAEIAEQWTAGWRLPLRIPAEVICHGDFAPYNCVFLEGALVGVFDFDFAHPGPRLWDLAYAVYRFAPIADPMNSEGFGTPAEQAQRMRIFCDAYGLADRTNLMNMVAARIQSMADYLLEGMALRDARRMAAVAEGHLRIYQCDVLYVEQNRSVFESALL